MSERIRRAKAATPDAGVSDPYFFEWTVGLEYVVDMLREDSEVAAITLQTPGPKGLDDVGVRFKSGATRFLQVKHSRTGAAFTLGDLVGESSDQPSLLSRLVDAWVAETHNPADLSEAWLVTNQSPGENPSTTRGPQAVQRPALAPFLA